MGILFCSNRYLISEAKSQYESIQHFQHIILTNDHNTLEKLHAFFENDDRVFILQGYTGSGKISILDYIHSDENI